MLNHPRVLTVVCVFVMWLMALAGVWARARQSVAKESNTNNLALVVSATLTLLGLIIGFTFSMASTRYDQRRVYEEQEANAIGTEYVRADLMAGSDAAQVKRLLREYLGWRIQFYELDYGPELDKANQQTVALQGELWASIRSQAAASPNPVTALVVSGMNDVLNSQGYTQSAWWNRIPRPAWGLMITIAVFANLLVGYSTESSRTGKILLFVLPIIVSISFFLISDIDSPRGGLIRIPPLDLQTLLLSMRG